MKELSHSKITHHEKDMQIEKLFDGIEAIEAQLKDRAEAHGQALKQQRVQMQQLQAIHQTQLRRLAQQNHLLEARSQELAKLAQKMEVELARAKQGAFKSKKNRVFGQSSGTPPK